MTNSDMATVLNYTRLEKEIRAKALTDLATLNEDNIRSFSEATKLIAISVLEEYIFTIDDLYSEGELKLKDEALLNEFSDFHNGYRAQMKRWIGENDIHFNKRPFSSKRPIIVASVGIVSTVCLAFLSKPWIAAAAGALTIGASIFTYRAERQKDKDNVVDAIIADIKNWLSEAQSFSDNLLKSFKVN